MANTKLKRPKKPAPKRARPVKTEKTKGALKTEKAPVRRPKKKRRRRRGRQTLNYMFFSIVGAIVLAILCYTVFFRVYNIEVTGDTSRYSAGEIITASGIQQKDSLFSVTQNSVNTAVLGRMPYVSGINVGKRFPTTITLEVMITEIAGVIEIEDRYLYIGVDGKILESNLTAYDRQYPLISGINATTTQPGNYVLNQNSEQIMMLRLLLDAIKKSGITDISYISLGDRLNMRMVYDNRLLIDLGTERDLDYKLEFLKETIEGHIPKDVEGVVDATIINKSITVSEQDINPLLEEDKNKVITVDGEAQTEQEKAPGIVVDPKTGAMIIGPRDPLNLDRGTSRQAGSEGQEGSSSEGESSSSSGSSSSSVGSSSSGGSSLGSGSSSGGGGSSSGGSSSSSGSGSSSGGGSSSKR